MMVVIENVVALNKKVFGFVKLLEELHGFQP